MYATILYLSVSVFLITVAHNVIRISEVLATLIIFVTAIISLLLVTYNCRIIDFICDGMNNVISLTKLAILKITYTGGTADIDTIRSLFSPSKTKYLSENRDIEYIIHAINSTNTLYDRVYTLGAEFGGTLVVLSDINTFENSLRQAFKNDDLYRSYISKYTIELGSGCYKYVNVQPLVTDIYRGLDAKLYPVICTTSNDKPELVIINNEDVKYIVLSSYSS